MIFTEGMFDSLRLFISKCDSIVDWLLRQY